MMQRRAPRPTRGGRTTGTPRARTRPTKDRISGRDRTMGPRPVRKRPTQTTGTVQAKRKLPPGMDIPKGGTARNTANVTVTMTSAADAARKELMKKKTASDRAGKARSTGTPKMNKRPAVTGRMTRKPTAVGRPRRPARPIRQRGRR